MGRVLEYEFQSFAEYHNIGIWSGVLSLADSVAGRKAELLEGSIQAVDLQLTEDDLRQLDTVSDPGTPYPK